MTPPEPGSTDAKEVERVGSVISGRYLIRERIGEGGMGAVYLAEHTHMKKRVALKLLHPEMVDNAEVSARFEREALAAAHIEHPNVAGATDFGKTEDGAFFLVLEYVEGTNLRDALTSGPLSVERALRIARQIALALERAHDAGIVHRDLKPENVMLVAREGEPDFVKVLDFGIAKVMELGAATASADLAQRKGGEPLTRLGTILGTPEYMAPEQALGEAVTPAADLYGVGVMLYEMLTGLHPFSPTDRMAMLSHHIVAPVPPMRERAPDVDVPAAVEAVARGLLEKDAKKRYPNARALVDAIEKCAFAIELDVAAPSLRGRDSSARAAPRAAASSKRPLTPATLDSERNIFEAPDAFAKTSVGGPAPHPSAARISDGGSASSAASSGAEAQDKDARSSVIDTLRQQPRHVLIAVGAALPIGFIVVLIAVIFAARTPKTSTAVASSAARGADTGEVGSARGVTADRVNAAVALGPEALEELVKEFPDDTSVLTKLAQAYYGQGRGADAIRVVRIVLAKNPEAANDGDIVDLVTATAARGQANADDEAFALLEGPLGSRGVDALIELTTRGAGREARDLRARAARSLAKPDVRAHATSAAAILLDFKAAQSCVAKRELLPRAREQGDARLLSALKPLKATRGCGFLSRSDCWSCLRRDSALESAIDAASARPAPK